MVSKYPNLLCFTTIFLKKLEISSQKIKQLQNNYWKEVIYRTWIINKLPLNVSHRTSRLYQTPDAENFAKLFSGLTPLNNALLVGLYYVFKLLCHDLHLVGFHVSFKYQIKHQIFLVPNRRETRGVVWIRFITIKNGFMHKKMQKYKRTLIKNQMRENAMKKIPFYLNSKTSKSH